MTESIPLGADVPMLRRISSLTEEQLRALKRIASASGGNWMRELDMTTTTLRMLGLVDCKQDMGMIKVTVCQRAAVALSLSEEAAE